MYAVCICVEQEITIKLIHVSLDHPIGFFFLMNNMMILMLLTVQGDIVQKIATKLNDWFRLKNIKYFLPRVSMFTTYLASVSNHQLACLKSYWCMYAYLNLSKHKRVWQNRILFPLYMYVVYLNNPLYIIVAFCF